MSSSSSVPQNTHPFLRPGAPRSTRSLGRGSSPQWKNHYSAVAKLWGSQSMASTMEADSMSRGELWQEVKEQKQKGVYPYTHLSHKQEEEVWIDPLSLPKDITTATLKRKEIPREWFHLPSGIEPPSTTDLLKESSEEDETLTSADLHHTRICGRGRSRSKSKEKKLNKNIKKEQEGIKAEAKKKTVVLRSEKDQILKKEEKRTFEPPPPPVQFPGPPVPPKFAHSREPFPLPAQRLSEAEDDGEYELDTRWVSSSSEKRKSRSRSRDASKKSPKSPRLFNKICGKSTPPPPPRTNKKEADDGGYEPVGRARKSFCEESVVKSGKAYEDLPENPTVEEVIDLPFTKGGARISKKDFVTVENSGEGEDKTDEVNIEGLASTLEALDKKEVSVSPQPPILIQEEKKKTELAELSKKEQKRIDKERSESEKKAKKEREKLAKEESERLKKLKKEQEKASKQDAERLKKEKKEQEKAEKLRIAKEKKEKQSKSKSVNGSANKVGGKSLPLLNTSETSATEETSSIKTPQDERSPTFVLIPSKNDDDETQITKTKVLVDVQEIDELGERNPFVDYLAYKFRETEANALGVETVNSETKNSGIELKQPELKSKAGTSTVKSQAESSVIESNEPEFKSSSKAPVETLTVKSQAESSVIESNEPELKSSSKATVKTSTVKSQAESSVIESNKPELKSSVKAKEATSTPISKEEPLEKPKETLSSTIKIPPKNLSISQPERPQAAINSKTDKIESQNAVSKTPIKTTTHKETHKTDNSRTEPSIEVVKTEIPLPPKNIVDIKTTKPTDTQLKTESKVIPEQPSFITIPKMEINPSPPSKQVVAKTKAEMNFESLFTNAALESVEKFKEQPKSTIITTNDELNKIEVIPENSSRIRKYSERKSSFQEYDEDQDLIYDPNEEKLDEACQERLEHLLHEEIHEESIPGEVVKLSKQEKKELKKMEREKKKANKVDKEQTLRQQKLQDRLEKQMIAKEKKDLEIADKERKKVGRDWLKTQKEEEKKLAKLEKEEGKKMAKFEKEEEKRLAKLEKKKKQPKRTFFKVLQNRGKAKSLSDLNENDPLIIKEYHFDDEDEEDPEENEIKTKKEEPAKKEIMDTKDVKTAVDKGIPFESKPEKDVKTEEIEVKTKEKEIRKEETEIKKEEKGIKAAEKEIKKEEIGIKKEEKGIKAAEKEIKSDDFLKSENIYESIKDKAGKSEGIASDTTTVLRSKTSADASSDMASKVSSLRDDFAAFKSHSGPSHDEEIDFTPQNGYVLDEKAMEDMGYIAVDEVVEEEAAKNKRKSRERRNFKAGLQKSVSNFNTKIRNARLPSPHELKEGYKNSNLHKTFQQPLVARSRVENVDVQKARALLVKHNTPSELAKMKHPLDIPLPKFGGGENKPEKPQGKDEAEDKPKENGFSEERPGSRGGKMYQTLPRSWRETQLITAVRENGDPEALAERQELVRTKTPSELAQLHSISDFPVPSRLTNLFHPSSNENDNINKNKSSTSIDKPPKEPFKMENIIPSSLRETKLITNVREMADNETIRSRQQMVQHNTPGELAKFHSLSDFPVPTRIENMFKPRSRSSSGTRKNAERRSSSSASVRSKSLTRSLSGTIPRSWRETQLLTGVKVDPNQEEIVRRRALIEHTTPAELSKITSVADLPVPTALQNIFSGSGNKADKGEKETNNEEKSSKPMNLEEMYNNLPRSLKTELLVKCVENDQDLTKKRQKLVESMKPSELASIGSLSEFPVPSVLENIFKEKEPSATTPRPEKRARNKTVIGLMSYENMPESLKKEVLVRSLEEDPELLKERRELVEKNTPAELSRIGGLSDFPLPEKIEGIVRPSRRNLKSTKDKDMAKKRSKSWSSLTNPKELYKSLPDSLKSEVLISVTVEDEETLKEHKKLVEENSVSELGQIHGLSDFPVPDTIVNLVKSDPNKSSRPETPAKSLRENFMDAMPESLKSEVLVRSLTEDPELLRERQELARSKTPNELSQISSISDFPIPTSVENMFKKKEGNEENDPVAPPRRWKKENLYESLPDSLKAEVLVRSKVEEDPEVLKMRQELVRSKSPAELSEIHGFEDIPIPSFLTKRKEDSDEASSKKDDEEPKSLYEKMPDSLKTEMLVRSLVETPEIQKERSELVKNKTVKELSQINGLDDIPVPNLQFLKKDKEKKEGDEEPGEKKSLYEQMPESLKAEVLVRAVFEDPKFTAENADLVKAKSVKELSEIRGLSDIPLPTRLEYVIGRKPRPVERRKMFREKQRSQSAKNLHERMYGSIPQSLKSELLVKSVFQDSELQLERRRLIQSKSVGELSQIHSLSEFPVPSVIGRFVSKNEEAGEGGEGRLSRMSMGNISLSRKSLYSALPKSLTTQDCLVRSRVEDPEVLKERRETVRTKSVSELATLNSISDFPIPTNVERFIQNRRAKSVDQPRLLDDSRPTSPLEKLRDNIPSSLKTELLVSSNVQDPETSAERKKLTESTSVHELSQLHGISDFPVPDTIQNFVKGRLSRNENPEENEGEEKSAPIDLYASLPKSLKQEVLVRSLVEVGDEDLLKKKALAESKSPAELSQIHSFSEIPVPSRIEAWLSSTDESKLGHPIAPPRSTRSFHELRENMYETLPKSLKEPTLVRTKMEDPEIQKSRSELTRSKTPSQLAEIHGINELPIPGLWNDGSPKKNFRSNASLNAVPKTKQEIKDYVYKTLFPESLVRPCIVRSKIEDQDRLLERQAIQQSKTIHELSKINNLSDFPLPGNIKLPPIPLPSTKGLFKMIKTKKKAKEATAAPPQDQLENQYNQVEETPYDNSGITDDEMLRYECSTPAESLIREQDFGYEVISAAEIEAREEQERLQQEQHRESDILNIDQIPDKFKEDMREPSPRLPDLPKTEQLRNNNVDEEEEDSQLVDHYRGTPPRALGRSKMKNKKNRQSQDSMEGEHIVERIQSRPLPAPPTPVRSRGKSAAKKDAQTGTVELPPSPGTGNESKDLQSSATTNTEVFHTVQSSLDRTLVKSRQSYDYDDETLADSVVDSMHSCAETLVDEDATLHEDLRDEDIFNNEPYQRTGSVEERLKNETHELSRELLEHVENLRTTLGNMSTRLGTTSPEPRKT